MLELLAPNWRLLLLRGVIAVMFGIFAVTVPALTLVALVLMFGAYAFADGVVSLVVAVTSRRGAGLAMPLVEGILGIAAGVITFIYPGITALWLLLLIAAWAILTGIAEIAGAIRLRREISGEWRLVLAGVLSLAFGVLLLLNPAAGALAVVWIIGIYAIVFGTLLFLLGVRLRRPATEIPA